jgi:hypothetical protein
VLLDDQVSEIKRKAVLSLFKYFEGSDKAYIYLKHSNKPDMWIRQILMRYCLKSSPGWLATTDLKYSERVSQIVLLAQILKIIYIYLG